MKRIVFLYSYKPSGHSKAAQAIEASFREGGEIEASELDVCGDLHPILGPVVARAYLELVRKTPSVWDALYDNDGVRRATKEFRDFVHLLQGFRLKERIQKLEPDLVVCTHALPCGSIAALKRSGALSCRLAAVPTDFSVHKYWLDPAVDLYIAPSPRAARELRQLGAPAAKVVDTGIPIQPGFERRPDKAAARRALGLDPERPTALLTGGSRGLGPLLAAAETALHSFVDAQVAVLCGNNTDLLKRARKRFGRHPRAHLFGFVPDAIQLTAAADVLVGKAGGVTLSEALAAGLPSLIFEPLPGQERHNCDYLMGEGAAWLAEGLNDLVDKLGRLLERGEDWKRLSERSLALGRPSSARSARQALEKLLHPARK
jgi:processive 1,2-diacylglycerol beta-glucosyltransferase